MRPARPHTSNFYPRPPRGGRRIHRNTRPGLLHISTHALREEGDRWQIYRPYSGMISTHALREEGDVQ